jgi:glycoside hydrolase-like protein
MSERCLWSDFSENGGLREMAVRSRGVWALSLTGVCALAAGAVFAVSSSSDPSGAGTTPAADAAGGSPARSASPSEAAVTTPVTSAASAGRPHAGTTSTAAARTVAYAGRRFQIPADWPVTDLRTDPTACVRFDQHAVYLGTPGPDERCPAQGVGRPAGALLISTASAATGSSLVQDAAGHSIKATASGVSVEASYGDDPSEVLRILNSAHMATAASPAATPTDTGSAAAPGTAQPSAAGSNNTPPSASVGRAAVAATAPTTFGMAGLGFDACTAPSAAAMQAWGASPFRTVGVYIGGADRACAQPNLTAAWVAQQAAANWHFLPLYVGPQLTSPSQITAPQSQAVQAADDAAQQAAALGFASGSVLYYDLEAYPSAQSATAVAFMSAWTQEIHARGYLSGIYSSEGSGIADLIANHGKISEPDVIDVANWNGQADSDPGSDPSGYWAGRRVHQFLGGTNDSPTYGGYTINIDQDYANLVATQCDMLVVPASPSASTTPKGTVVWTAPIGSCIATSR